MVSGTLIYVTMSNVMTNPGRPRKTETDARIIQAASELVVEYGYSQVTVDQVVERAGTNKPAFYRRFRRLADVVPHALLALDHVLDDIDTESLVQDLAEFQRRQRLLFSAPLITRGLPGWLAEVSSTPNHAAPFIEQFQAPRREALRSILQRATNRGEIKLPRDVEWVTDLLTAPLMMRAIIPGLPRIDGQLLRQSVHAALDALQYQGHRQALFQPNPVDRKSP